MKLNKKIVLAAAIGIVAVICGVFGWIQISSGPVDKKDTSTIVVDIPAGSSTGSIAEVLKDNDTVKNTFVFKIKSKLGGYDGTYKAGQYAVNKAMSMKEQMEMIKSGETVGQVFTVLEGNTLEKDSKIVEKAGIVTADAFLKEAAEGKFDYKFLKGIPNRANRLEGFLYPDTYQVSMDADAHEVIDTMLKQFDKVFTDEYYAQAKKILSNNRHFLNEVAKALVEKKTLRAKDIKEIKQKLNIC